jgi:hypothetical protein
VKKYFKLNHAEAAPHLTLTSSQRR